MATEECPLCCEAPTLPTQLRPELPNGRLHFNYCCECINRCKGPPHTRSIRWIQPAQSVQCPQCHVQSEIYSSQIIACRSCCESAPLSDSLGPVDSELPASALQTKHAFLRETSLEDLQDAVRSFRNIPQSMVSIPSFHP
jgi:hypothetical protein